MTYHLEYLSTTSAWAPFFEDVEVQDVNSEELVSLAKTMAEWYPQYTFRIVNNVGEVLYVLNECYSAARGVLSVFAYMTKRCPYNVLQNSCAMRDNKTCTIVDCPILAKVQ